MKRFRPRRRPDLLGRRTTWAVFGAVWFVLVILFLIWMGWPHSSEVTATLENATNRQPAAGITVRYTGGLWNGKPVYRLDNRGASLHHVNLYNWAEDTLPVLWIGATKPKTWPAAHSVTKPPYEIPTGSVAWFVGSSLPPSKYTITWEASGSVQYTTVSVPATEKP